MVTVVTSPWNNELGDVVETISHLSPRSSRWATVRQIGAQIVSTLSILLAYLFSTLSSLVQATGGHYADSQAQAVVLQQVY